jgi:hypothetical protein
MQHYLSVSLCKAIRQKDVSSRTKSATLPNRPKSPQIALVFFQVSGIGFGLNDRAETQL